MKTFHYSALSFLALGVALGGCRTALAQGTAAPAASKPADTFEQTRETQIMAQVLQDSLQALWAKDAAPAPEKSAKQSDDSTQQAENAKKQMQDDLAQLERQEKAALGRRLGSNSDTSVFLPGASPFRVNRGPVGASYVPTVGAIFNLSVDFPLSAPPAAPAADAPEQKPAKDDLWEQHSQPAVVGAYDARTNSRIETSNGVTRIIQDGGDPFSGSQQKASGPAYDPARVAALRKAVLETVGKYGRRMEHLADDERILIVISSSSSPRGAYAVAPKAASAPYTYTGTSSITTRPVKFGGATDNLLLSIRKSDLKKEIDAEQLGQGRVIERSYLSDNGRGVIQSNTYVSRGANSVFGGGSSDLINFGRFDEAQATLAP